jgi:hypothetical protein
MAKSILHLVIRLVVYGFLLSVIFLLLSRCKVKELPATTSIGLVISVDGDRVLATFEVVSEQRGSQASNWFYIPGHSYQKGDRYPDPAKDPSLRHLFPRLP